MTSIAALTAAALLAGLSASPLGPVPAPGGDVVWRAGQAVWNGTSGRYELGGDVVVQRGAVVLRAQRATVDPTTGEVWARGDVLLVDATRAVSAEAIHAVLDGPFEADQVVAFLKDAPLDPVKVASAADARRGRNRLTFRADRVEGDRLEGDDERLRLSGIRFTPCDCGEGKAPSWELGARRAEVEGDRVSLHWPVLRIRPPFAAAPVPVLAAPWLSLPLTDRQTGLLFPELGRTASGGFHLGLPIFVTLGRSADLTATPEYFFGGSAVEGPGAKVELRWAPAERAYGQVLFHVVEDLDRERLGSGERGGGGLRLSIEGFHGQDLGKDTRLGAHLALSQDPFMFRDFRGQGLPGDAFYSRSDVLVSHRTDRWVLEGGAAYYEQLDPVTTLRRPGPASWFDVRAPKLQRWPSAAATLLPWQLGPIAVEGRVGLSRFAPLVGHRDQLLFTDPASNPREGVVISAAGTPQAVIHALPREAVSRADARLQLSAPALLGGWLAFEPFVRGATATYAFDAGRSPATTAWGVGGASASVELSRRYGSVEHRIVPRLELLAGTETWRVDPGDPFAAYDLWDRIESRRAVPVDVDGTSTRLPVAQKLTAAPDHGYLQARASLQNRIEAGPAGQLTLEVGQDAELRGGEPKLAETFASLSLARGPFSGDASARFLAFGGRPPRTPGWRSSWLDEFTRLHVGAAVHDARGDQLRLALDSTGSGTVGSLGAGVDALFDLRPSGVAPDAWYRAGTRLVLGAARLDYEIRLAGRRVPAVQCGGGKTRSDVRELRAVEQTAALVWDSPCHCFVAGVTAGLDLCGTPTYGVTVDLSKMFQGAAPKPR